MKRAGYSRFPPNKNRSLTKLFKIPFMRMETNQVHVHYDHLLFSERIKKEWLKKREKGYSFRTENKKISCFCRF